MGWFAAALTVGALCVLLSARRLWCVLQVAHLERPPPARRDALDPHAPVGSLEHELQQALDHADGWDALDEVERDDLAASALRELDHALGRGQRWPSTCARIASSLGFLLAAAQLRETLLQPSLGWDQSLPQLLLAVQIVASAFCASMLCAALGREADRLQRSERTRIHGWVEALAAPSGEAHALAAPSSEARALAAPSDEAHALAGPSGEAEAR